MKNIKYFLLAAIGFATITSCEYEPDIYDNVNGATLVSFGATTYDLPITIDATGTLDVVINASTVSNVDRTFNVSVDMDASTAIAGSYNVPASVTVPANSYSATMTITGTDVVGVETTAESLVISIEDGASFATGTNATISVFQVCPIPSDYFVGQYEISDNAIVFGGTNFSTRNVDVTIGGSATVRTFTTDWSGGPNFDVVINLVCNELVYASTNSTGFTGGGEPIIITPAADNQSTYDLADDSFFIVEYDNIAGSFGTFEGSFFLIKL